MPVIAPIIGAVAAVVGTVGSLMYQAKSLKEQKKAVAYQKQAAEKQIEQQDLATTRSNRQAVREAQLNRARALMSAQGAGAMGGSGVAGGIGAISSQLGSAMGFATQYNAYSREIGQLGSKANEATGQANIYAGKAQFMSGIASLGGQLYNADFSGLFGGGAGAPSPGGLNYTPVNTNYNVPAPTRAAVPMAPYNPAVRPYGNI